ncbi:3'-5' exonuclease [Thermodesulfobacteriota bacterium]
MAKMHPIDIEGYEKATEGEKRVFRFLKKAARPHKDFICWYEPSIGTSGAEPDFILFSKRLGLLVIEVKDWSAKQIISYNPHQFTILASEKKLKKSNPDRQARGYVVALKDKLQEFPEFISDHPRHAGNVKIPIGRMVAFPNISREEYSESRFKWFVESESTLFRDDLESAGEILHDRSGRKFCDRISTVFPFLFNGITPKEVDTLGFIIWPEVKIALPHRPGSGKSKFQRSVQALDEAQARLALRMEPGHQIIKGPPGSGKTLLLVHRCSHLYKYQPKIKQILLVCYNITLVSYLKRLIQEKGLGTSNSGIHVYHFYELCSGVLEESVHFENEDSEYYALVTREALEKVKSGHSPIGPFDAILVDEGQDFSTDMLGVLLSLLRPEGDLVVSLDNYQDLYMARPSWKSLGIKASGRTHHLKKAYRNTRQIFEFTQRFIGEGPRVGRQLPLLPDDFEFRGEPPELRQFQDDDSIEDFMIRDLEESIKDQEYKRSEIAIIYDDKVYGLDRFAYDNRAIPMRILNQLNSAGIPATWVSQDVRSKEMYDVTTDRVSLISIHSSKGLDFDLAYLVGMDRIHPTAQNRRRLISLIYVAMTRAKYRLVIPYVEETAIIEKMKGCL